MDFSPAELSFPVALSEPERAELVARAERTLDSLGIPEEIRRLLGPFHLPLAAHLDRLARRSGRILVIGLEGAQGSGKTTVVSVLARLLGGLFQRRTITLSIDDFYLSRDDRLRLAESTSPLFRTRGVPGTHDVPLALATLDRLRALGPGERLRLPAFDKAIDDRLPQDAWPEAVGPIDLVLFEGWCVGVRPMPTDGLVEPINELERERDPDGTWRRVIQASLEGSYRDLFARLDRLLVLVPPSFEVVLGWRKEQEHALRRVRGPSAGMDDAELEVFVAHYERVTRWAIEDLPRIADLVVHLDRQRRPTAIEVRPSFSAEEGEGRR